MWLIEVKDRKIESFPTLGMACTLSDAMAQGFKRGVSNSRCDPELDAAEFSKAWAAQGCKLLRRSETPQAE